MVAKRFTIIIKICMQTSKSLERKIKEKTNIPIEPYTWSLIGKEMDRRIDGYFKL